MPPPDGSILAVDIGTSAVKAILWNPDEGVLARANVPLETSHPGPGYAEQDPDAWWAAVRTAIAALPSGTYRAIGFSSQRETFVPLDDSGRPLRPALLWSDRRAPTPAGRLEWLRTHEPDVVRRLRRLAAPRDYVVAQMTGRLITDTTMASRTDIPVELQPEIVEPTDVVGTFDDAPVVAGAGDRACEALAVHADATAPMVSWGTTANVSVPVDVGTPTPPGWVASVGVHGGPLLEAGMSAAGSALGWLARVTGQSVDTLRQQAADAPPGANDTIVLPWFNGARAPWWQPDATAVVGGMNLRTTPGDLARALYEGVAHDIRRALDRLPTRPVELRLAGGGVHDVAWRDCLGGITGLPLAQSDIADAAAVGAALLTAQAVGITPPAFWSSSSLVRKPRADLVAAYVTLAPAHDAAAAALIRTPR